MITMLLGESRDYVGYGMRCKQCGHTIPIDQMRISAHFHADMGDGGSIRIQLPTLCNLNTHRQNVFQAICPKCRGMMSIYDNVIEKATQLLDMVFQESEDGKKFFLVKGNVTRGADIVYPHIQFMSPVPMTIEQYEKADRPAISIMDGPYFIKMKITRASRTTIVNHKNETARDAEHLAIEPVSDAIPQAIHIDASDNTVEDAELLVRDATLRLILMVVRAYVVANTVEMTYEMTKLTVDIMRYCCGIEGNIIHNFNIRNVLNME